MGKRFLASVANVELFAKENGELVHFASAKTLTDSSIGFSLSMEEVRAGQGGKLYGRFGHTSGMTLSMTDAMFDLNYVRALLGANIENGATYIKSDKIENAPATISGIEAEAIGTISGLDKKVAWAHELGKEDEYELTVSAAGEISIPTALQGKTICVSYFTNDAAAKLMKVSANFIPAELVAVMTAQEFAGDASAPETGKPVGHLIIKLPRFQLDGQFDLALNMTSAASVALNGTALAVEDFNDCEGGSYYAEIVEKVNGASVFDGLRELVVDEDYLTTNDKPAVYGVYGDGIRKIDNKTLKFTPDLTSDGKWGSTGSVTVEAVEVGISDTVTIVAG